MMLVVLCCVVLSESLSKVKYPTAVSFAVARDPSKFQPRLPAGPVLLRDTN